MRPILISISPNRQQPQQFQHLGRIIKVLHNYFTSGLGQAILQNLQDLQKSIREDYRFESIPSHGQQRRAKLDELKLYYQMQAAHAQSTAAGQGGQMTPEPAVVPPNPPFNITREAVERELTILVDSHNVKVQQISCAVGIINTLHLFYQRTDNAGQDFKNMTLIVRQLLDF